VQWVTPKCQKKKSNSGHVVVINNIFLLSKCDYGKTCFVHNL
jgi:hypothetical protein